MAPQPRGAFPLMNPYLSPESAIPSPTIVRRRPTRTALVGAWLQLGPLIGFAVKTIALHRALTAMGEWKDGIPDPKDLRHAIDVSVMAMVSGNWAGLLGSVLLGIAVFRQKCRVTWIVVLFWVSLAHVLFGVCRAVLAVLNLSGG